MANDKINENELRQTGKRKRKFFYRSLLLIFLLLAAAFALTFFSDHVPQLSEDTPESEYAVLQDIMNTLSDSMIDENGYVRDTAQITLSPNENAILLNAALRNLRKSGVLPENTDFSALWKNGILEVSALIPWSDTSSQKTYFFVKLLPEITNGKPHVHCISAKIGLLPLPSGVLDLLVNKAISDLSKHERVREMMKIFVSLNVLPDNSLVLVFHPQDIGKMSKLLLSENKK